jgi:hypothetical protein
MTEIEKRYIKKLFNDTKNTALDYLPNEPEILSQAIIIFSQLQYINIETKEEVLKLRWNKLLPEVINFYNYLIDDIENRNLILEFIEYMIDKLEEKEFYEICYNYKYFLDKVIEIDKRYFEFF